VGTFAKKMKSVADKLRTLEPEYRLAVYRQIERERIKKLQLKKGSLFLPGSFENGKKR